MTPDDGPADGATATVGGTISFSSSGWKAGATITVVAHSDPVLLGTAQASGAGTLDATFALPSSITPGTHTLILTGLGADGQPATATMALIIMTVPAPASLRGAPLSLGRGATTPAAPSDAPISFTG